jgi:hypothetical protein
MLQGIEGLEHENGECLQRIHGRRMKLQRRLDDVSDDQRIEVG